MDPEIPTPHRVTPACIQARLEKPASRQHSVLHRVLENGSKQISVVIKGHHHHLVKGSDGIGLCPQPNAPDREAVVAVIDQTLIVQPGLERSPFAMIRSLCHWLSAGVQRSRLQACDVRETASVAGEHQAAPPAAVGQAEERRRRSKRRPHFSTAKRTAKRQSPAEHGLHPRGAVYFWWRQAPLINDRRTIQLRRLMRRSPDFQSKRRVAWTNSVVTSWRRRCFGRANR